jgi:hypothetical protein
MNPRGCSLKKILLHSPKKSEKNPKNLRNPKKIQKKTKNPQKSQNHKKKIQKIQKFLGLGGIY